VQRLLTVDTATANRYDNLVLGTTSANFQLLALGNALRWRERTTPRPPAALTPSTVLSQ